MNKKNKNSYKDEYSSEFKKDCKGYTAIPDTLSKRKRIIAIGDVHGDLNLTVKNLLIAKVIEETDKGKDVLEITYEDTSVKYYKWIGGDTVVVQVGDQVDRCRPIGYGTVCVNDKGSTIDDEHSDIKIIDLFTELNKLASKSSKKRNTVGGSENSNNSGMVISLLGNHELMNYQGNVNYVSYKGVHNNDFEGPNSTYKKEDGSYFDDGIEGRRFAFNSKINEKLACTRQSSVIVGSFIFVHGGIVPELAKKFKVSEINNLIRKWLLKKIGDNDERIENLVQVPSESPFWTRLFGNLPPGLDYNDERCSDSLDGVLKTWGENNNGLKGMVIGHTPQMEYGINSTCSNKVWRVDVGASKAFDVFERLKSKGRKPSVLEILDDGREFNILT